MIDVKLKPIRLGMGVLKFEGTRSKALGRVPQNPKSTINYGQSLARRSKIM